MTTLSITALAKVGKVRGVKGDLKLYPLTEEVERLFNYQNWYLKYPQKSWSQAPAFSIKRLGQNLLIHFENINSPEAARVFVNTLVGIPLEVLPKLPEGEFYWAQLVGLEVINQQGERLGKVDTLLATGANDVLIVKGKHELLIPYIDHVVIEIDLAAGRMIVDWDNEVL